jgi:ATP-dependent helicase/DNAse subunit B
MTIDSAASLDEAGVALAAALTTGASADEQRALRWLQVHSSSYWKNIYDGRRIEINRLSPGIFDRYSGRLQDERLIAVVARELNAERTWSASQLNDYGVCGFRFFAKRLLMLEELQEPDEGMDVLQRGTLFHAILEHTYRALSQSKIVIEPDNLDLALSIAREITDAVFAEAPEQIGFRVDALWQQEQATIWRRIEQLIKADFATGNDSPLNKKFGEGRLPIVLEAGFGGDGDVTLDLDDGVGAIKVRGYIDRIDQWGERAIIVDYKSGSTRIPITEMEEGRNFQMMTYLEGANSILRQTADGGAPLEIAGGAFWHITNRSLSGEVRMDRDDHQQAIENARQRLGNNIALGRRGDFAVHATKMDNNRCIRYCEYHQLCRISLTNRRKR